MFKCEKCDVKVKCEDDLKRHERDCHEMNTFSLSPKNKISKMDVQNDSEDMEIDELKSTQSFKCIKREIIFKAMPDGACAFNSAAFFLFNDELKGHSLRKHVNKQIIKSFEH